MAFQLGTDGYFIRDGKRFIPVGVNYWPASAGVELWPHWPAHEIRHDLDVIRSLGLNTVRFFLRWQDFEPRPGEYDPLMLGRLRNMLEWCRNAGVVAHPSLVVGFMSGGVFWPQWRQGRNAFADPFMVQRAAEFAAAVSRIIAPFHDNVLAIDQGNELCCLADSSDAPPAAVIEWCRIFNEGIRSTYPDALILSGNEQNQVINDTGWRLGRQPGCDLYSMHGYPVPRWHSVGFDGMTDPLAQSILPLYTQVARAFGPVFVQEFGTIATFGRDPQDQYLRGMLPAAWEAGGNGFLWWCLRDVTADVHPYVKNNFESTLGLVDAQDRVKPGLGYFIEFARSLADRPAPVPARDAIGICFPCNYYNRDNPLNPGNDPRSAGRWLVICNYLLQRLGHKTRIVRGDQPIDPSIRTIVNPGMFIDAREAAALAVWVESGGRLIWHGIDPVNWGHAFMRLTGAAVVDYRACRPVTLDAFGGRWSFDHFPRSMPPQVAPRSAIVLARDDRGLPMVLANSLGRGCVVTALPTVEEAVARLADDPPSRDRWTAWYAGMLASAR